MKISQESLLDGRQEFRVITLATDGLEEQPLQESQELVVMSNGYRSVPEMQLPLVGAWVSQAEAEGRAMRVVLHDSPHSGAKAYGLDYHIERLARVVEHVTHNQLPARLAGHSLGHPQHVAVGGNMLASGRPPLSILSFNPNSLTPAKFTPLAVGRTALGSRHEVRSYNNQKSQSELESELQPAAGRLGFNPLRAAPQGYQLLTRNTIAATVELEAELTEANGYSSLRITAGTQDRVCPAEVMRHNLQFAGFPMRSFVELDTYHCGPLADLRHAKVLYDSLLSRDTNQVSASAVA